MWTLRTNGSEPLTRQVKEEKLKLRAGKRSLFPETELNVWKCALKLVVDEVPDQLPDIPFAEYLIKILESERSESRRDPDKLCDLISLIAWMRRFQKPLEEEDKADIVDLYFALQIGLDAITQTIGELDKKEQKIFRTVQHGVDEIVTRRYVANETGIPYKTCYRLLEKLIDKGFMLKEKRGRENEYSTPSGKQPKEFLIVESSSKNNAKQLMQFILSSFGTLSPSQGNATQKKFSLIDLITGDQVTVTPTGEIDVEKKTILYPDDNVRTSKRSEETLSKPQNKSAR